MDEAQAADILETLRAELAEAIQSIVAAQKRAASLEKLIQGYVELFPALAPVQHVYASDFLTMSETATVSVLRPPRGKDAILKVLQAPEYRGRYWTVSQLTDELIQRGWTPESDQPVNAVRTTLTRVTETDHRVHRGRGANNHIVWYYQHEDMPPPHFEGERAREFKIVSARYVPTGESQVMGGVDVTDTVQSNVIGGHLDMIVSNDELGGDPSPGRPKQLVIEWRWGVRKFTTTFQEGNEATLP
jgi:hypothetical protein